MFVFFLIILVISTFSCLLSFSLPPEYNLHKTRTLYVLSNTITYAKNSIWQRVGFQSISVE